MTAWIWLDLLPRSGADQMAQDHAQLDMAEHEGVTILRLYRWDRDTVSFGANEAAALRWDRDRLEQAAPAVRRPTGGRAVWHAADDLTYSLAMPIDGPGEVRTAYRTIHERIAAAFATLDITTALAASPPRLPGLGPGACFDVAVGGEVLANGRKAVGSAQLARPGALLQHGAIARADRSGELARFKSGAPGERGVVVAPDLPAADILAAALRIAWQDSGAADAPPELTQRARQMSVQHLDHYRDPAWTWRR